MENIVLSSVDKNLVCIHFDNYSEIVSKEHSSTQGAAYLFIAYMNGEKVSTLKIQFDIKLNHEKVKFDDSYVIAVQAGNKTTERGVDLNRPKILNDGNKTTLSNIRQMLDGNSTTCLRLPLKGERPPMFLMRILTTWLSIERKNFDVMIKGVGISCDSYGKRNLLVSFPTNNVMESFQGVFKICSLMNEGETLEENVTHCTYRCDCKSDAECNELIIFMSNEEQSGNWGLCQLRVKNLE